MHQPKIIFGMPSVEGLADVIDEALQHQGFDVISLNQLSQRQSYPNLRAQLYAQWRKHLFSDKQTAKRLKAQALQNQLSGCLQNTSADYALTISADVYDVSLLHFIQQHSHNGIVNYQFDSISRSPEITQRIAYFDRFYVFDPADAQRYQLPFATNFYFEHLPSVSGSLNNVYFFGSHQSSRAAHIAEFSKHIQKLGYTSNIQVYCKNRTQAQMYAHSAVQCVSRRIHFQTNLAHAQRAAVLADFVIAEHQGLSFRAFEALGYRKKLITTNAAIQYYDFYHENNIFVWNGNNLDELAHFLQQPYHEIAADIRQKYSFGNWIRSILNIKPHQAIELPTHVQAA